MKCPKCGYISFDFNEKCPNCNRELKEVREKLSLFSFKTSPVDWLTEEEAASKEFTKEEIELEKISLDSLAGEQMDTEKPKSAVETEETLSEGEEIEIEPVDLKSLEEQIQKRKEEAVQKEEKEEIELEPIELENLEIEFEKDEEKK